MDQTISFPVRAGVDPAASSGQHKEVRLSSQTSMFAAEDACPQAVSTEHAAERECLRQVIQDTNETLFGIYQSVIGYWQQGVYAIRCFRARTPLPRAARRRREVG